MSNKHPQSINDLPESLRRKIHHEAAVESSKEQEKMLNSVSKSGDSDMEVPSIYQNKTQPQMNQQNKTERWVEEFRQTFRPDYNGGGSLKRIAEYSKKLKNTKVDLGEVENFITQLLSDARRELLDEILDDFGNYDDGCGCCARHTLQEKLTEKYKEALTTAEESIKNLK